MLFELGVNERLAKAHSVARKLPGSIITWTGAKYELAAESKVQSGLWAILIATGSVCYGLNGLSAYSSGDLGMSLLCGFFAIGAAAVSATLLTFRKDAPDSIAFLNGVLRIAEECNTDQAFHEAVRPRILVKLFTRMMLLSQVVYPWFFSLIVIPWPCSFLSMFSSTGRGWWCGGGVAPGLLARALVGAGIGAAHVLFWKSFVSQGTIDLIHIFLGSLCQSALMQFLAKKLHAGVPLDLNLYRRCQLLNVCFSNYISSVVILLVMVILASEMSTSYLVVKIVDGSNQLPVLVQLILVSLCVTAYLLHGMAVGEAARVHTYSRSVLRKAMKQVNKGQSKLSRRQLSSVWPLKVKFGQCNFIEGNTTLILLDFSLTRVVDLLLIEE